MDLVVTILTIFLLIALGTIVFLINDAKKKSDSSVLSEQLEEKISNSIESVYAKREEDFKKSSKENIENIIEPFKKRIKEFEEEVRKNTSQQHEFHTKTKLTIDNLIEQTNQITSDANKLTKALSGDSKTQGDYGELKLEMLLEGSGLEENTHYLLQKVSQSNLMAMSAGRYLMLLSIYHKIEILLLIQSSHSLYITNIATLIL